MTSPTFDNKKAAIVESDRLTAKRSVSYAVTYNTSSCLYSVSVYLPFFEDNEEVVYFSELIKPRQVSLEF